MPTKLSFDYVKSFVEQEGYALLSTEYVNSQSKLAMQCSQGHQFLVSFSNFKNRGSRCPVCAGNQPLTIKQVRKAIQEAGHALLSKQYISTHRKLQIACDQGHQYEITFANFQSGGRCPYCAKKKVSLEQVKTYVESFGGTLLSDRYVGHHEPLEIRCRNAHTHTTTWRNLNQSKELGCRQCIAADQALDIETVRRFVADEGHELTSKTYINAHHKMKIKCPKGHLYQCTWNKFYGGCRCPKCGTSQSHAEKEIIQLYSNTKHIEKDRSEISPYELDLFFPDQNVAIEYCGLYWHSTAAPNSHPSSYHRNKLDMCIKKDIRLLTIFEDEWLNHKEICKSRINNALGITEHVIYGRNTTAKEITKQQAKVFLQKTHLQGYGGCKKAFGLFDKHDKLISVMTWSAPSRAHTAKGKKILEMKRFASDLDTRVIGGASKLLKLGLQFAADHQYEYVKSYCDLRWGTGVLYQKLGFHKTHETKYTPHYTDCRRRFRNQKLAQNKKQTGKTEAEVASENKLYKIYDCGHSTWEMKV